ncbi:S-type pyocin domain-containing protein [Pseudomonas sp. Teo4]|uniref:S-type pyocin domain-containing protein n=1 Tax=Pseudomonas sp. Teo4 TaxID=3064528 RepID=UPI002AB94782|nr:S-type pyocin domain-containing protein [Pseudomonas sp. Teo4]MDZ3991118.1 hypothetical protein [Pseudomonas sp. Teo4]
MKLKTSIYGTLNSATRKQYITEDLLILKAEQATAAEKEAKKLLGYSLDSRPNRVNVANYEKKYGKVQQNLELFKQRFTESHRAAAAHAQAVQEHVYLTLRVLELFPDKTRALQQPLKVLDAAKKAAAARSATAKAEAERIAAAKAKAEADRIAAAKAKAEADRIAAAKAKAEADRIAAAKAKAEADRIAAAKAKAEADRIAAAKAKAEADRIAAAKAKAEADRIAAAKAKAEADRIAAAKAKAEADRIAAAKAKAEADRIAAAKAKAEADRIAAAKAKAEAEFVRLANTYTASGSVAVGGSIIITAAGYLGTAVIELSAARVLGAAVAALGGYVASGLAIGAAALLYSPSLGNGELPRRYLLQTPLSDLDPQSSATLATVTSASHVDLPYRLSSQVNAQDESEIFVVKTDGAIVPSQVPILTAQYDAQKNVYTAITADVPPRTLTWTPIVTPGDASTSLPVEQSAPPIYQGATLKPVELRIDSFPGAADAGWDDYVIIFPADSGLPPIYAMFQDRREEPGTGSGAGFEVGDNWAKGVETREGAPIPRQIADLLRGQQFKNWRAYREALWKAISGDSFLSAQFDPVSIGRMRKGIAPFARLHERVGALASLQIHHKIPLSEGGDIYNSENIVIVTPRQHIDIHHGENQ